jgi:hypothetical protein
MRELTSANGPVDERSDEVFRDLHRSMAFVMPNAAQEPFRALPRLLGMQSRPRIIFLDAVAYRLDMLGRQGYDFGM